MTEIDLRAFGYAPGNYWFVCRGCGNKQAVGAKRSTRCESCAHSAYLIKQEADNTRPAAPVEGLETKAWNCSYPTYGHFTLKEHEAKQAIEEGATVEELVTRSQSEAIIAAGRAQTDAYGIALMMIREGCENPSLVARNALERFSK